MLFFQILPPCGILPTLQLKVRPFNSRWFFTYSWSFFHDTVFATFCESGHRSVGVVNIPLTGYGLDEPVDGWMFGYRWCLGISTAIFNFIIIVLVVLNNNGNTINFINKSLKKLFNNNNNGIVIVFNSFIH